MSKNVRVANIQATIVLRCSNEPVLKADSESVRISEISQQMPEIPTFFCQFGLNLWKLEKKKEIGNLCQIDRSFEGKEEENRFQREIRANSTNFLPIQ